MGQFNWLGTYANPSHLAFDDVAEIWRSSSGAVSAISGIVNLPLTVKEIEAVAFFKEAGPDDWRVSMRSKGDVDVNAVAKEFGGGGHKNASGCSANGKLADLKLLFEHKLLHQIEATESTRT